MAKKQLKEKEQTSRVAFTLRVLFLSLFCIFILVFGAMTLRNNNSLNKLEQRELVQWPSLASVFDGSMTLEQFCSDMTTAFSDQLFMRDTLVKGYYAFHLQSYDSGAVEGKNGQLYRTPETLPKSWAKTDASLKEVSSEMADVIDECAAAGATKFFYAPVPRKDAVMTSNLPSGYTSSNTIYRHCYDVLIPEIEKQSESGIFEPVDVLDLFTSTSTTDYYFATDHHFNIRGAYLLYSTIFSSIANEFPSMKIPDLDSDYEISSSVVNGSLARLLGMSVIPDAEELCISYKEDVSYTRSDNGSKSSAELTAPSANSYKEAYMGGDFGETVIETNNEDAPNVLIVGTSYTNALEALSIPSVHRMVSVDYRHNDSGKSIADYVKEYDIDYVIFINSSSVSAISKTNIEKQLGNSALGEDEDAEVE